MSTAVVRIPTEVHKEASRFAALCGEQTSTLLAQAWREFVVNHREDFARDLERAAELMRNGALEDLVEFTQASHRRVLVVEAEDLVAATEDHQVQAAHARADAAHIRLVNEGRDHAF